MAWVIENLVDGRWITGPHRYESFFEAYNQWNSLNGKYGRYRIAREKIKSTDKEKIRIEGCLIKYDTPLHDGSCDIPCPIKQVDEEPQKEHSIGSNLK